MSALLELAERVEALSGPDREVDALVWAATVAGYVEANSIWYDDRGWVKHAVTLGDGMVRERTRLGDPRQAPAYTASLDAAMTLLGEWIYIEHRRFDDGTFGTDLEVVGVKVHTITGSGANQVLALLSAALRARSASL